MELISQGMRNKEIAAALGISFETAQVHVKNILAKLKVQDRTAAVSVRRSDADHRAALTQQFPIRHSRWQITSSPDRSSEMSLRELPIAVCGLSEYPANVTGKLRYLLHVIAAAGQGR